LQEHTLVHHLSIHIRILKKVLSNILIRSHFQRIHHQTSLSNTNLCIAILSFRQTNHLILDMHILHIHLTTTWQ